MSDADFEHFDQWVKRDGDTFEFEITRASIQPGRTISAEALNAIIDEVTLCIGSRIARRWDRTNEPPSAVLITVTVDVH